MTILIVDDDPGWIKILSRVLTSLQYQVCAASTWAAAKLRRPDCILLDCSLEGGTAAGFCAALKADAELEKIPVIVLSGAEEERTSCGADRFILKGSHFSEITGAVAEVLKKTEG
jgi:CheY-like chemotaxis protein